MDNNPQENQEIIKLLQENNRLLAEIHFFLIKQDRHARNMAILRFILGAIPYIALLILIWFLLKTIQDYLDTLNNNINAIKLNYENLVQTVRNTPQEVFNSLKDYFQSSLINPFN